MFELVIEPLVVLPQTLLDSVFHLSGECKSPIEE